MQVRELIQLLSRFDGDLEVRMEQNGGEYESDLESMEVVSEDGQLWLLD